MDEDEIIKEYGIEFAIESIATRISQKMDEYKNKHDEKSKKELTKLIEDREMIYKGNKDVIRKYLK